MKSVTEKGLEILLRQGYGGQERGGGRGGEKGPFLNALFPSRVGKITFLYPKIFSQTAFYF